MTSMTDPMNALVQLQSALDNRAVEKHACEIHRDLYVIADRPNGTPRYTYVNFHNGAVRSIALFVLAESVEGIPCFQMGWATREDMRSQGLATDLIAKAIEELQTGLKRYGLEKFYLEAIVSESNKWSKRIAHKLLSDSPVESTDCYSGEPAVQYLRLIG